MFIECSERGARVAALEERKKEAGRKRLLMTGEGLAADAKKRKGKGNDEI